MLTEQSYVGRGTYANPSPQSGQIGLQTAKNQAITYQAVEPSQPVSPRIYEAKSRLLDLEDRFAERGNYAPIQVAEDLLLHWLTTSPEDLTAEDDADQLHIVLMLLDTLDEAYSVEGLPTINRKGLRVEPSRLYKKYTRRLSPDFLNLFTLPECDESRAGLMVMPDARLEPQIRQGSTVLVLPFEAHDYPLAQGLVILATHSAPDQPLSGRIIENDGQSLLLLPDNPTYCELRFCFASLRFLSAIKHSLNQPLI